MLSNDTNVYIRNLILFFFCVLYSPSLNKLSVVFCNRPLSPGQTFQIKIGMAVGGEEQSGIEIGVTDNDPESLPSLELMKTLDTGNTLLFCDESILLNTKEYMMINNSLRNVQVSDAIRSV